jgi:hypothetical protein
MASQPQYNNYGQGGYGQGNPYDQGGSQPGYGNSNPGTFRTTAERGREDTRMLHLPCA